MVLYNTRVHVNIAFGQFDSFYNLQNEINTLPFMHSNKKGSDLDHLFNTTFAKIPEVFLLVKEELNEKYAVGLRVADGKLKGVKKIAVTFGVQSNVRDISDFHAVLQYGDTSKFSEFSVISKITDIICHGKSLYSYNSSKDKFQSQLVRVFFFFFLLTLSITGLVSGSLLLVCTCFLQAVPRKRKGKQQQKTL